MFPNPAEDHFYLSPGVLNLTGAHLQIRDLAGKILYEEILSGSGRMKISSVAFSKGIYSVEIILNKERIFGEKLVIFK